MIVGAAIGLGVGMVGGLTLGSYVFKDLKPHLQSLKAVHSTADRDESVPDPIGPVKPEFFKLLKFAPSWTMWPDYERLAWLNTLISLLWPYLDKAIQKMVQEIAGPEIQKVVDENDLLEAVTIEEFQLGEKPLLLPGMKVYDMRDDEAILELPIQWGSLMKIRVSVKLRLGPVCLYIPVEVNDIQIRAVARVSITPLVEVLPCVGGVRVALLQPPHIDMQLRLINSWDIFAFPLVKPIVDTVVASVIQGICLYPNQIDVPLMENGGHPIPPAGMLQLRLSRLTELSISRPYLIMYCKKTRKHWTDMQKSRGEVDYEGEEVRILVEDEEKQSLMIELWNDDLGKDSRVGLLALPLKKQQADFVAEPQEPKNLELPIFQAPKKAKGLASLQSLAGNTALPLEGAKIVGKLLMEVTYVPFLKPDQGDEEPDLTPELIEIKQLTRIVPSSLRVSPDVKGLLTVTVIRCFNLPMVDGVMSAYVEVQLIDPEREPGRDVQLQKTAVIQNDTSPRWGARMEFVMVSATSSLTFTVLDKPGTFESLFSVGRAEDKQVGKISMMVGDVVKNRRLKDNWPLQEARQGEIELKLEWRSLLLH